MRLARFAGMLVLASPDLFAQAPGTPAFDVASVKPTRNGRNAEGFSRSSVNVPSPGRFLATNSSLDECIRWAYEVKDYQISGPDWLNSDAASFDIEAKAPPETPIAQIRLMVQTLLAERFKLRLHRETRMLSIYVLVAGKNGPKLQAGDADGRMGTSTGGGRMVAHHVSMAQFAYQLSREIGRPVFDKTGIEGAFDITLEYAPVNSADAGPRPSIFTAIQERTGLRLEAAKGPVEILVIDHMEKLPTEN